MSHLAIFLSVSIPSFLFWNLSIFHGSIVLVPLILNSSHPPSFRQQPSSLSRQHALFFLVFVVLGWLKFNRVLWVFQVFSSEVSQSCAWGTEGGLKTNRTDFSTRLPPQRLTHTQTHRIHLLTPGISSWQLTVYSRWSCSLDLHLQQRLCLRYCWWLGRYNGRWNKKLHVKAGLSEKG